MPRRTFKPSSEWQHHRVRITILARQKPVDEEAMADAKRDLTAARLADVIPAIMADAPPLTFEQRGRLAGIILNERVP
jgi:hypothetical protein